MLFMVTETFRDVPAMRHRFQTQGRLMPAGVSYHASWLDPAGGRCFQVMEAADRATLQTWIDRWSDIVDFDVVPVLTSKDYWDSTAKP